MSRDKHGGLPETAGLFTLRVMESVILQRLLPFNGRFGGGGGQLRQLKAWTISFNHCYPLISDVKEDYVTVAGLPR
ncbi:uncharacterized protein V6R79_013044 [Siganus canaliculatus]